VLALTVVVGSALLFSSSDFPAYNATQKAYYADAAVINFVRPGLVAKIETAAIANDGTITVKFRLSDPMTLPLDIAGITTPGPISTKFVIGTIPAGQEQYVSYLTRTATAASGVQATQATSDSGGTYQQVGDGEYTYTFKYKIPVAAPRAPNAVVGRSLGMPGAAARGRAAGPSVMVARGRAMGRAVMDADTVVVSDAEPAVEPAAAPSAAPSFDTHATHTIGMWAARDLSAFNLSSIIDQDSDVYSWVPDGSAVTVTRDVIRSQSCNKCHDPLSAHDERKKIELCVICHTPQTVDPDSGNTVDMKVFIHKIHMGSQLPSVVAGTPYQIIGYQNAVSDFSTVVFPADPRNCTFCHEQNTGAAQATAYLNPTRAACGSCHDNVNFATGENHVNLPEIDDTQCAGCHIPQGELEFDASIVGGHTIPTASKTLTGFVFNIVSVTNAAAGQNPTVTFTVRDNAGNGIAIAKDSVSLVMAGPTTDYPSFVSEAVKTAPGTADGTYTWTMKNAIPATATGTFSIGIEGYQSTTLLPGTVLAQTIREAGINKVYNFSVDGSTVQPRRKVVDIAKCNTCHSFLSVHGGNRNEIEQCVLCHNPNQTDSPVRPASQAPARTVNFAYMIHRIHTGDQSTAEYTIYGFGGSKNDFTDIRFPGDRRNCAECHVNNSEQLPLSAGHLNVSDPRGLLNPMGPATGACTGCHTDVATASHALSNTTQQLGEACSVCHGTDDEFSVPKMHAR
jgi:OmcA/MtrC family decaheme c-type cytochrome